MHPRAIMTTIVTLGLAFGVVVWLGKASQEPLVVETAPTAEAEETEVPDVVTSGPMPTAVFDETKHFFGIKPHLYKGSHKFVVTNKGEGPLELVTGKSTCQCTIGNLSDGVVAPGESTEIELTWEIKNPAMWFEHSAEIWTNDGENRKTNLTVRGYCGRSVVIRPDGGWNIGSISSKKEESRFTGYIASELHEDLKIEEITLDSDAFELVHDKLSDKEIKEAFDGGLFVDSSFPDQTPPLPVCVYRVKVIAVKDIVVGKFSKQLKVTAKYQGEGTETKTTTAETQVFGVKSGPIDFFALPGTRFVKKQMIVSAGEFDAADGKKASLLLFVRDAVDKFEITGVDKELTWLDVETEQKENRGNAQVLQVNFIFKKDCPTAIFTATDPAIITLKTNHPEVDEVKLKLAFISR